MMPVATGNLRESRIEATVVRTVVPAAGDPRPWQLHQCPHCQGIFWAWVKGTVSYWHRNPLRRLAWLFTSFRKGE
jgi:hypothetical protein